MVRMLVVATAFEALRAGAGTFRALIDLPARHEIGAVAFADFSRATDLSVVGVMFYALYGIGGALITGAALGFAVRTRAPALVRRLALVSLAASVAILVFTTQAAPLMWRVGSASADPVLLGSLFDEFTTWTVLRVVCADVSFVAMLAALAHAAMRKADEEVRDA